MSELIRPAFSSWSMVNARIRDAVAGLSPEQLAVPATSGHWPLWAVVGHLTCQRVFWLCDFAGEPGAATSPFPDAANNCPGDDDLEQVLSGADLATALDSTFAIVEGVLDSWTVSSLAEVIRRPEWGDDWAKSRGDVIQRVFAHDLTHAAEVSAGLVALGLPALAIWP